MLNPVDVEEVFADGLDHRIGWDAEDHSRNPRNVPRRQQEQNDGQRMNLEAAPDDVRVDNVPINLLDDQNDNDHRNQFLRGHRQRDK